MGEYWRLPVVANQSVIRLHMDVRELQLCQSCVKVAVSADGYESTGVND